jgi:hypothetical protein
MAAVTRHAPLHTADGSAFTDSHLPNDLAHLVWIKGVDHTRFLSSYEKVPSRNRNQHG